MNKLKSFMTHRGSCRSGMASTGTVGVSPGTTAEALAELLPGTQRRRGVQAGLHVLLAFCTHVCDLLSGRYLQ